MNTQTQNIVYSEIAQRVIELGRARHHFYQIVGSGPVPETTYIEGNWRIEPVKVAPKGQDRIDHLKASGVAIKGIVVAHELEVPQVKPAPVKPVAQPQKQDFKVETPDILPAVAVVAGGLAMGLFLLLELLLHLDPMVIVVLEDNTWVCVLTYYD